MDIGLNSAMAQEIAEQLLMYTFAQQFSFGMVLWYESFYESPTVVSTLALQDSDLKGGRHCSIRI